MHSDFIREHLAVVAFLAWAAATPAATLPAREPIAIVGVTIVDLERSHAPRPRTLLIKDGRIAAIMAAHDRRIPAAAQRVDGRGRFLVPGLVDMHVHLFNNASRRPPNDWAFALFIANGVTGVREMNAQPAGMATLQLWRRALDSGDLVAPRILAAGIAVRGGSPQEAAAQVEAAAAAGADFIKVFSEVAVADWRSALDAARRHALPLAGHVPAGLPLRDAAAAGQRSNEHLTQTFEACSSLETTLLAERRASVPNASPAQRDAEEVRALDTYDQRRCRRVATELAATRQAQVPTLVLAYTEATRGGEPLSADPRWSYLRADERLRWERALAGIQPADSALAKRRWSAVRRIVALFQHAGVPFLSGTDAPMPGVYPGFSLHQELRLLVESGLSPRQALRAATLAPAEFLGIDADAGSVAVGKRADLVLLDADPARDIRHTQAIHAVVLDGRLLRRADLDALLAQAAQAQSR